MIHNSKKFTASFLRAPKFPLSNRMLHGILLGLTMLCLFFASSNANASCGMPVKPIKPMAWQFQGRALLPRSGVFSQTDPIVGMWHVVFQAQSQNGQAIPPTPIDNAVVVWHSDGTEIMNSSRSAQDGNFCLGVWKHTGARTYLLNHIPWQGNIFDPTVPPDTIGAPQAGAQIIENVTLSADGNSYTGTFTLHAYLPNGQVYVWFSGVLAAIRITPTTPFSALF